MPSLRFSSGAIQGARAYQEDSCRVDDVAAGGASTGSAASSQIGAHVLAVLADGMGGHAGGAVASELCCSAFFQAWSAPPRDGPSEVRLRLISGLTAANDAILDHIGRRPGLRGMGATIVGIAIEPSRAHWISVGDSPLYLVRRGEIARLNEDHSLAPMLDRMVAEGAMSEADAQADPRRHHLRSAVSGDEIDLLDLSQRPLAPEAGDCLVIASDGTHALTEAEIARLVARGISEGPDAVVRGLLAAVEQASMPHQDNATVIAVTVDA